VTECDATTIPAFTDRSCLIDMSKFTLSFGYSVGDYIYAII